jgi:hypothetical protein
MILVYKCYNIDDECCETLYELGTDLVSLLRKIAANRDPKAMYLFYRGENPTRPFMYIEPLED